MTELLATQLADKLIEVGAAPAEKRAIIRFGLELILSSVIGILLVALISTIVGQPLSWISFLIAFIPLRTTGGGYHAKTHLGCNVTFAITYILALLIVRFFPVSPCVYVIICVISALVIFAICPVEAINKPLNESRKKSNRKKCILWILADIVLSIVCLIFNLRSNWVQMYYLGVFAATLSQIAALIINLKGEKNNEVNTNQHHS